MSPAASADRDCDVQPSPHGNTPTEQSHDSYAPPMKLLGSGLCAGVFARLVTHPMDTLRTLQQTKGSAATGGGLFHRTAASLYAKHGIRPFYHGLSISVLMGAPASALYLTAYEIVKKVLVDRHRERHPTDPLQGPSLHLIHWCAGISAEIVSGVLWVPIDIVKQRMQASPDRTLSIRGVLTDLHRAHGIRGWYMGYLATLATFGPFSGVYFMTYEFTKSHYPFQTHRDFAQHLACGFISGAFAAAVTCPLDVIKTRIQVLDSHQTGDIANGQNVRSLHSPSKRIIPATMELYAREGLLGFARGLFPRIAWIAPTTAISIASFEFFKNTGLVPPNSDM